MWKSARARYMPRVEWESLTARSERNGELWRDDADAPPRWDGGTDFEAICAAGYGATADSEGMSLMAPFAQGR